jgi:hypothetical protein
LNDAAARKRYREIQNQVKRLSKVSSREITNAAPTKFSLWQVMEPSGEGTAAHHTDSDNNNEGMRTFYDSAQSSDDEGDGEIGLDGTEPRYSWLSGISVEEREELQTYCKDLKQLLGSVPSPQ